MLYFVNRKKVVHLENVILGSIYIIIIQHLLDFFLPLCLPTSNCTYCGTYMFIMCNDPTKGTGPSS